MYKEIAISAALLFGSYSFKTELHEYVIDNNKDTVMIIDRNITCADEGSDGHWDVASCRGRYHLNPGQGIQDACSDLYIDAIIADTGWRSNRLLVDSAIERICKD